MLLGRNLKSHVGLQIRYSSTTHAANNPVGTEAGRHNRVQLYERRILNIEPLPDSYKIYKIISYKINRKNR